MMQNCNILTVTEHHSHVCYLITKPPHHLHHSTIITLGWCRQYMYVNGNCWYRQATTAVHSKHIIVTVTQMLFWEYCGSGPRIPNDWCRKV